MEKAVNKTGSIKVFIRYFLITFIVGVLAFIPATKLLYKAGEVPIFGVPETSLMDEMPRLVETDSRFFDAFQDKNRINVMLMGFNENLADTIMVASFDYDARHVDLISIPRDTYYYRKGYHNPGALKINAIYQRTNKPLETAMVVSEILLGMPLHYYAIVDYDGIKKIVKAIGGVPMDIPFDMRYKDLTPGYPPFYVNIPKGQQVLDGDLAIQFLRYRKGYTEGDIGRIKAHQQFMKSAFKQMLSFDLPKTTKVIFENVESDITLSKIMKISAKAVGMTEKDIETYIMPNTLQDGAPYYVYPDSKGILEMLTEIYSVEAEEESSAD